MLEEELSIEGHLTGFHHTWNNIWPLMARVMTLLSRVMSLRIALFLTIKEGKGKGRMGGGTGLCQKMIYSMYGFHTVLYV